MLRFLSRRLRYRTSRVTAGALKLDALVADSFLKQVVGLMFRPRLGKNSGMLFPFPFSARHGIWMRNMRIAIDIIWLDSAKRVVDIAHDVRPSSRKVHYPRKRAKYVLEVNSGTAKRNRIKEGLALRFAL